MEGGNSEELRAGALPEEYAAKAMQFVVNAHATTVNMHLYPPTSAMVTETLEKAKQWIEELIAETGTFRVSALENSLLVNDVRLDDVDQQKMPIRSFISWMSERGLSSMEFNEGVTGDEIRDLFELLSNTDRGELDATLSDVLEEKGITHATINQRVYVAINAGEDGEFGRRSSPLDALKDELLLRYLMGKVELGEVENRELESVLSDPAKVGGLLSSFLSEEGSEGGVLFRSQKAEDALAKLSQMVGEVEDESLRETLNDQVTSIIAEMTPKEMMSVLAGHGPETLDIRHVRSNVIKMLSNNQLMDIVDSLIDEYVEMSEEGGELETEWTRQRLRDLNEVLLEVRNGERGAELAERIDQRLDEAGISEERDASTGTRVLSAHQMLGGTLDEADVPPDLGEGVDMTASRQVKQLYLMGETDLAAGMLMRIADNLTSPSDKVRRYAALLLKESLEGLEDSQMPLAAGAVQTLLFQAAEAETDYQAYGRMADSLAAIGGAMLRLGEPGQVGMVVEFLNRQADPETGRGSELRKYSSAIIDTISPGEFLDPVELLTEKDPEKFTNIVQALSSLGPRALSPMVDLIKDRGRVELRERALEAFRIAGSAGTQALVNELGRENQWYVYRNILNMIAEMRAVDALDAVNKMVGSNDERIRREAVRTLARIGARESVPWVQQAVSDPSPAVRKTAVRVIGMFSDASVAPLLLEIISGQGAHGKDEDQGVIEAAILALGDLRLDIHIPPLVELVGKGGLFKKGRPEEIRAAACVALGNIGVESVRPTLEKALKDPSPLVKAAADRALARIGTVAQPARRPEPLITVPLQREEAWDQGQSLHPVWRPPETEPKPEPSSQSWQEPIPQEIQTPPEQQVAPGAVQAPEQQAAPAPQPQAAPPQLAPAPEPEPQVAPLSQAVPHSPMPGGQVAPTEAVPGPEAVPQSEKAGAEQDEQPHLGTPRSWDPPPPPEPDEGSQGGGFTVPPPPDVW